MKSLKTYNMDRNAIEILSRQPNKSAYVNNAVREKHSRIKEVYAVDFDTRSLCIALKNKADIPAHIKRELINFLID